MRLDPAFVNIAASPNGVTRHGTRRLLHDLVAVGRMEEERLSASERLEGYLGAPFLHVLKQSLGIDRPQGLRPHRAA